MPDHVHLVFSLPPAGVSDADYDAFYERHLDEILAGDGFNGARRYWLEPASPERPDVEFRHLAVYRTEGPPAAALATLAERQDAGEITLPEWFDGVRFLTYDGRPLEDAELGYPDEGYVVLSHAPARFNTDEFYGWYYAHARENLTSDGFDGLWRYALTPVLADADKAGRATHGALYDCHGELADLRAALKASADAGRVDLPAWMPECEFFSYYGRAASPARASSPR
jgi:hypothetical protein